MTIVGKPDAILQVATVVRVYTETSVLEAMRMMKIKILQKNLISGWG